MEITEKILNRKTFIKLGTIFFTIVFANVFFGCVNAPKKSDSTLVLNAPKMTLNQEKLQVVDSDFMFLRTFVEYYYALSLENKKNLPVYQSLQNFTGWCVGDAHVENFGFIVQSAEGEPISTVFTVNDMDDSGPCPLILDLDRLLLSASLVEKSFLQENFVSQFHKYYLSGLNQEKVKMPDGLMKKQMSSLKKGIVVQPKKILGPLFVRDKNSSEVSPVKRKNISQLLPAYKILDVISTVKKNGGSAGLQRYQVLVQNKKSEILHFELKPLVTPAIELIASGSIPEDSIRIANSVRFFQKEMVNENYKVVTLDNSSFLLRPRYWGNLDVEMNELSSAEKQETVLYEAYVLGKMHAESLTLSLNQWNQAMESLDMKTWRSELDSLNQHYTSRKFSPGSSSRDQK